MAQALSRRLVVLIIGLALAVALGVGAYVAVNRAIEPDPETIASASLRGLRTQNKLSAFVARFVAVVTSEETRFGLSAKKTLILPGTVRYEVDLSKLSAKDVHWDAGSRTLDVTLPPVTISGPEIDIDKVREYGAGGIVMALTNAEAELDAVNRKAGQAELMAQAREPMPMQLARDATRNAIMHNFAVPLAAAGLKATVTVKFRDEG